MKENYCINSKIVLNSAIKSSQKKFEDFQINPNVIIFFSEYLFEKLKEKMELSENDWLTRYHPYTSSKLFSGKYRNISISAISPPMGASPLASVCEDLIFCGAKNILLVCGSWGIGFEVKLLDFIIPTHSLGPDGTSVFYGRKLNEKGIINEDIVKILIKISSKKSIDVHIGKNYSMEAFYRISKESIYKLREEGIISMENGELNILNTICNNVGVNFGALFYSYINPLKGWKIPWINSDIYRNVVEMELNIALETFLKLES